MYQEVAMNLNDKIAQIERLAEAKRLGDLDTIAKIYHSKICLVSESLSSEQNGIESVMTQIPFFLSVFKDYTVSPVEFREDNDQLIMDAVLSFKLIKGEVNTSIQNLPSTMIFNFKEEKIIKETFEIEINALCGQMNISPKAFLNSINTYSDIKQNSLHQ
jgi:hypothetical protein